MNGLQHFQTLAKYNSRLNQQVLAATSSLSFDQINEDHSSYFKPILDTLNQILVDDLLWLRGFYLHHGPDNQTFLKLKALDKYPTFESTGQMLLTNLQTLKNTRFKIEKIISDWVITQLSEADLNNKFTNQRRKRQQEFW